MPCAIKLVQSFIEPHAASDMLAAPAAMVVTDGGDVVFYSRRSLAHSSV